LIPARIDAAKEFGDLLKESGLKKGT